MKAILLLSCLIGTAAAVGQTPSNLAPVAGVEPGAGWLSWNAVTNAAGYWYHCENSATNFQAYTVATNVPIEFAPGTNYFAVKAVRSSDGALSGWNSGVWTYGVRQVITAQPGTVPTSGAGARGDFIPWPGTSPVSFVATNSGLFDWRVSVSNAPSLQRVD